MGDPREDRARERRQRLSLPFRTPPAAEDILREKQDRLRELRPLVEEAHEVLEAVREGAPGILAEVMDVAYQRLPEADAVGEHACLILGEIRGLLARARAAEDLVARYEAARKAAGLDDPTAAE